MADCRAGNASAHAGCNSPTTLAAIIKPFRLRFGQLGIAVPGRLPPHILVVEDHADTRTAIGRVLRNAGYDVALATDGASALELARRDRFDLVLCDLALPDGDGWGLFRRLHDELGVEGVAFSALAYPADVQRSLEAGFVTHLCKPMSTEEILQNIELALRLIGRTRIAGLPNG